MTNKENVAKIIEEFLMSEEKGLLITGTNQYEKHLIAMKVINKVYKNKRVLFRTNSMGMVEEHLEFVKRQPKAGEKLRIGNNTYEFDALTSRVTWPKTSHTFSVVIVYPIDVIARGGVSMECIDELFEYKNFDKLILVSWTDNLVNDYSKFDKYVDRKCVYDADDLEYHTRVWNSIHNK